jgi:phosphoribosylformylglycinamidine cyclo-ligase
MAKEKKQRKPVTYKDSGVDVEKGETVVKNIEDLLHATWNQNIVPEVSGFKAVYDMGTHYLLGATDGVGTKLMIAMMLERFDTVGEDLVAMCVNDLGRAGAKPLFFLDYMVTGKLDENDHYEIVIGIVEGCKKGGFPLMGGETAEMPGMYDPGEFDLAGFAVGYVAKDKIIDGKNIKPRATLLGIESSGLHSNGYSLVRKIIFEQENMGVDDYVEELGETIGEALLEPTIIYTKPLQDILAIFPNQIQGMAHITGGGMPNKLPKALPKGLGAYVDENNWSVPPIFNYLAKTGPVEKEEMRNTFNGGIGMVLAINDNGVVPDLAAYLLEKHSLAAYDIGKIVEGKGVNYV